METVSAMVLTALILGLTWAVRGHFGHEWGAAWAGATGGLAILVAAGRVDWLRRLPTLAALGAVGWGAGGMMSYGIVVGYCRADTFHNSLYGYAMLAVIGGLYGFIGGGMLGLGLETSDDQRPNWFVLISGMVAGGCLFWGIIVHQLEWFMTPPRSEAWGLCAGAAIALGWYTCSEGFPRAFRLAAFTGLGGGIGFSLGNFFQTLGSLSGVAYNWWNVMEFTLGCCGGLAMAYAASTSEWPAAAKPSRLANGISLAFLALLLPWTNFVNAFEFEKLNRLASRIAAEDSAAFVSKQQSIGLSLLVVMALGGLFLGKLLSQRADVALPRLGALVLFAYTLYYVAFGFIVKGFFYRRLSIGDSDILYLPILGCAVAVWLVARRSPLAAAPMATARSLGFEFVALGASLFVILVVLATATTSLHDGKMNFHERFPTESRPAAPDILPSSKS